MNIDLGDIDKELFLAIKCGNKDAFEQLFKKYYAGLCSFCGTILDDQIQAEDVVQDLFVYLWNNRKVVNVEGPVKTYLFSSVKKRALNVLKHRAVERNHSVLLMEFLKELSVSGYSEEEMFQMEKIRHIIENLSPQCRIVFTMSCLDGTKYKEIADELDISVNTVKSHITKAYREIRAEFDMKALFLFFRFFDSWKRDSH